MGQTTETELDADQRVAAFYDDLADDYDRMTGFDKRFVHERPFFHMLVEKFGIRTALDAGSGTGFHSLLLAQLGVAVTAVDISAHMLRKLSAHADELGVHIQPVESSFQDLPSRVHDAFDAVFCLGNSLAHLHSSADLRDSLHSFASLLRPQGLLFLQLLNYDRILTQRERVQSVKEVGGTTFIRFYDYEKDSVGFNILKLEKRNNAVETSISKIMLRPILKDDLLSVLAEAGFADAKVFGSISMDEFDVRSSKDTVVLATKAL
jgi:sarcosine/dimethylglycine N-methyltransferase